MKCEEFESIGLDAGRDASLSELQRVAAREHAGNCSRCAALQDSWQVASFELRGFADATQSTPISPRVELRLRQEFRMQHRTIKTRRFALVSAWGLAAAAVIVGAVGWHNWSQSKRIEEARRLNSTQSVQSAQGNSGASSVAASADDALLADNDLSDFTLLPGSFPVAGDDAAIVHVRLQRGSLTALGLPVNEERASDWIQVDLLVGNDGLPEGVRLPTE